ncbi:glutamic acid-rich protein-like [Helianthus annuus]|uniref:glutamic acid-rich protein-like n=1 Tax=Helianthus annuus TaxID=4232 RepID=UPI000B907228|nr:glutamic acid-rich protein-like [Helianthus annuus]
MLVDESEEEDEGVDEGDVEKVQDPISPETEQILKDIDYELETEKGVGDNEGDESSSSSSEEDIDETERAKRIQAEVEKEKQLKRKRREDKDDELYNPSPEHVVESQTPPSSGGRKKASARKRVVTLSAVRRKITIKLPKRILKSKQSQPPSPPPEPSPPQSPHKSPPKQPTPPPSPPPHLSPPHLSPPHEQPFVTSQQIFQTPPSTQPPIHTTPGSSGLKNFPNIPVNIPLEDIGDFGFVNDEQVKRLEKKMEEVLIENKKLVDREKKLEKRVKSVEAENSSLLKKIEADQAEIDILKVKVAELEEEKARRDEQNKYFELKNKELEAAKAMKEHEIYMMNKVLENLLGEAVEQRFEEIEVEEVRARRQVEIDVEMKYKGKGVEGISEIAETSIVPSSVSESPIQNPRPIYAVSGIFEEDVLIDDVIDDEEEVEEDDDEDKTDDADDVFSASSHSDDDDDDNGQGGTGVKVTEAFNEENVEDYLHNDMNEEPEDATSEGENVEDQNVDKREKLILRLHGVPHSGF